MLVISKRHINEHKKTHADLPIHGKKQFSFLFFLIPTLFHSSRSPPLRGSLNNIILAKDGRVPREKHKEVACDLVQVLGCLD